MNNVAGNTLMAASGTPSANLSELRNASLREARMNRLRAALNSNFTPSAPPAAAAATSRRGRPGPAYVAPPRTRKNRKARRNTRRNMRRANRR